jgi:exodeoxyribonuclease-3
VQELKAQEVDLAPEILFPPGLNAYFHYAKKKGYSGSGIFTPHAVEHMQLGFGNPEFDAEGRYVEVQIGQLSVISVYMPSGSSSPERQEAKFRFLDAFLPHLIQLKKSGRQILLCGDVNIAHHEIDLKNWKGNLKNSGFLPEERAWLTNLFSELGYVDVYRQLEPNASDTCYTWWSQRGQAYAKNVGWRIDYQIATPELAQSARKAGVYKEQRFSDHAPLIIEYNWKL